MRATTVQKAPLPLGPQQQAMYNQNIAAPEPRLVPIPDRGTAIERQAHRPDYFWFVRPAGCNWIMDAWRNGWVGGGWGWMEMGAGNDLEACGSWPSGPAPPLSVPHRWRIRSPPVQLRPSQFFSSLKQSFQLTFCPSRPTPSTCTISLIVTLLTERPPNLYLLNRTPVLLKEYPYLKSLRPP